MRAGPHGSNYTVQTLIWHVTNPDKPYDLSGVEGYLSLEEWQKDPSKVVNMTPEPRVYVLRTNVHDVGEQ